MLAPQPVEVAAAVTGASVFEGQLTVHVLEACWNIEGIVAKSAIRIQGIVNLFFYVDFYPAYGVYGLHEAAEVDADVVVDGDAQVILHRFGGQGGPATWKLLQVAGVMGGVNAILAIARDRHPQVTGDGKHARRHVLWINGQHDHGVGAPGAILVLSLVNAQEENVHPLFFLPVGQGLTADADIALSLLALAGDGGQHIGQQRKLRMRYRFSYGDVKATAGGDSSQE